MLLRTCPRCGDFFADDAPPFCPADGTPLADVDPRAEGWEEGVRVVEVKTRSMQRRVRRLKLRRVFMSMMTIIVMTMVVIVVVINYVIYLKPDREANALLAAVTPTPSPPSPTPVPLPAPSATPKPSPTPTPTPRCTDADRHAAEELIVRKNRARWDEAVDRAVAAARPAIIERHVPPFLTPRGEHVREGKAVPSRPEYRVTFTKDCEAATVNAHYTWRVTWDAATGREAGGKDVKDKKTFRCSKDGAAWRCP